jgi:guanosine-3',5'-bis(diphosphate) 3'-pyrophosphohydrolase
MNDIRTLSSVTPTRSPFRPALRPASRPVLAQASGLIERASDLANRAHMGQKRKMTGIPYIVHPYRVACLVEQFGGTEDQIAAAWCHDVLEDCPDFRKVLPEVLPQPALSMVRQLTKELDRDGKSVKGELFMIQLRAMSSAAAFVKIADRIDNLRDAIHTLPKEWLARYLPESEQLHAILADREGCALIGAQLAATITDANAHLEA